MKGHLKRNRIAQISAPEHLPVRSYTHLYSMFSPSLLAASALVKVRDAVDGSPRLRSQSERHAHSPVVARQPPPVCHHYDVIMTAVVVILAVAQSCYIL